MEISTERAFLPEPDPLFEFPAGSEYRYLDDLGRDLPSLLQDNGFRDRAKAWVLPPWRAPADPAQRLAHLRLYYVRLGFLASAYINHVGHPPATVLPRNLSVPLSLACAALNRPPILSYDGYALYNWKRFDPKGPIELGNIDTHQNFVHLYDERWFILVHVEIEALATLIIEGISLASKALRESDGTLMNRALTLVGDTVWKQVAVLRRIPEKMDPAIYYKAFRPYIRFFEGVVYEGVDVSPMNYRGETGAQSSIVPLLVSFMKIQHERSLLTDHLADMKNFMPAEHRKLLAEVQAMPAVAPLAEAEAFDNVLEALATFREVHLGWASEYINKRVTDPRGTGSTPYMQWLNQLVTETRAHKLGK